MIILQRGIAFRKLILEGNSLLNLGGINSTAVSNYNQRYTSTKIFDGVKSIIPAYIDYSISGQTQSTINANINTRIIPHANKEDVLFIWEGTNDMFVNPALDGSSAYNNLSSYLFQVIPLFKKVIVGTVIARDHPSDTANMMTRIGDYNTLVRNNASLSGYLVADFAANPIFATKAAASNTTYYYDKVHTTQAGSDIIASSVISIILSIF